MQTRRFVLGCLVLLICAGAGLWAGRMVVSRRLLARFRSVQNESHLPPPPPEYRGITAPWRIGVQAGHWKIEELPLELSRLRTSTGARYGQYREADVNLSIATRLVRRLQLAGIQADLLPATIPPSYNADIFVSIHADGANRPRARGWKISTPWRPSPASKTLRSFVASSYARHTRMPEDRYGVTYNMRGYYAFSPHRFRHAIANTTPAIIIETGFVTVAADRDILFDQQTRVVDGITEGLILYLSQRQPLEWAELWPRRYPVMAVAADEAPLYIVPDPDSPVRETLPRTTRVWPVDEQGGWTEVIIRRNYRRFGWVRSETLEVIR